MEDKLLDIICVQVDETDNNAKVCNQCAEAQLSDIAHKGKGHQGHKEDGDPHNLIQVCAAETVDYESKLLGKEDAVATVDDEAKKSVDQ